MVGLVGKKRSGKDTVADIFSNYHQFVRYYFARPIKKALEIIFDWDERHSEGSLKEIVDPRWGISPREAMQHLGTEWAQIDLPEVYSEFNRVCGRELRVKIFLQWYERQKIIASFPKTFIKVIITDVRFPHEVEAIRNLGGVIVKVERPEIDSVDSHESESYIDKIIPNFTFINNVSKEELKESVLCYIGDLYEKE